MCSGGDTTTLPLKGRKRFLFQAMWLFRLNKRVTRNPSLRKISFKTFWRRMICDPHPPAHLYPDPEQLHGRHLLCIFCQCQVLVAQLDMFLGMSSALIRLRSIIVSSVIWDFSQWCDVTMVCKQIQYPLGNLCPFRCVYCIICNVSNVGETTSIKWLYLFQCLCQWAPESRLCSC